MSQLIRKSIRQTQKKLSLLKEKVTTSMDTHFIPNTPWIQGWQHKTSARLRLFCFPYAGGGASIYRDYSDQLPADIEVWPIQLPGREHRFTETPFSTLKELIEALQQALQPYLDVPYAFFGHSMGALISFELVRALRTQGTVADPRHLILSGYPAPQLPNLDPPTHHLPDSLFLEKVCHPSEAPEEIRLHPELLQLLLPLLRADFALCETYTYSAAPPLDCSISAYAGIQDPGLSQESMMAWKEQTTGPFQVRFFPGDHFFLLQEQPQLLMALTRDLRQNSQHSF